VHYFAVDLKKVPATILKFRFARKQIFLKKTNARPGRKLQLAGKAVFPGSFCSTIAHPGNI
jgi:hypothetical protein